MLACRLYVVVLATCAFVQQVKADATTVFANSSRDVALAFADPAVDAVVLQGSTALRDSDWAGLDTPVLRLRNLTVRGNGSEDVPDSWPLLDLGFIAKKVRLGPDVTLALRGLVLRNFRAGNNFQTPGLDLLERTITPDQAYVVVTNAMVVLSGCYPLDAPFKVVTGYLMKLDNVAYLCVSVLPLDCVLALGTACYNRWATGDWVAGPLPPPGGLLGAVGPIAPLQGSSQHLDVGAVVGGVLAGIAMLALLTALLALSLAASKRGAGRRSWRRRQPCSAELALHESSSGGAGSQGKLREEEQRCGSQGACGQELGGSDPSKRVGGNGAGCGAVEQNGNGQGTTLYDILAVASKISALL